FLHSTQIYATLFHACALHGNIKQAMQLHEHMINNFPNEPQDLFVTNHLINMYAKFGYLDDARHLFDEMPKRNVVSWTALISGYAQHGNAEECFRLFCSLLQYFFPNEFSLASVLISCDYLHGKLVHALALKFSLDAHVYVANALINMYSKSCADEAWKVFENMEFRNVISWNSMIAAFRACKLEAQAIELFAKMKNEEEALFLFRQLQREGMAPDWCTFSIVLKACAGLVTERHASAVHSLIAKYGFEDDTVIANALIHAYARCGSISLSKQVFDKMTYHDLVSWNSILKAYALHGQAKEALQLFSNMNVQPDSATFVSLLSACSHAGLVQEGNKVFHSMLENHGVVPQLDHYACMVDLLGRVGRILEAEKLIREMPMEPDSVIWSVLLGSCRKHGETRLAELAATKLKQLEPGDSLGFVQMSNIYCLSGSFNKARLIRKEMKGSRVRKYPGLSWIEIENRVHEFASGGKRHPQREAIFKKLEELIGQLKGMGYVPETSLALHDIEEEHKEEQLYHHSEKLALVFAIMNQGSLCRERSVIRIMKNIRICVDCHNFMKLASDLLGKEIVVRDSNRFHHFKDRICSCNDYW
ncbi:hypothetical protein CISIN_1g043490mg, partial [Citrus sinensis]